MKNTKYLLFLSLFLLATSLWAQRVELKEADVWLQKISDHTQGIHSLQTDFRQEKVLSFLENAIISEGLFYYAQPEQIRWEYQKPYVYVMIMNNGILTVKDEGDEYTTDLSSNKMFEQLNSLIAGSIQGKLLEEENNYQKLYFQDDLNIIVRFIPYSEELKAYLQHIEIYFDKNDLNVNQLIMMEAGGDYTRIAFFNRLINPEILENVFK